MRELTYQKLRTAIRQIIAAEDPELLIQHYKDREWMYDFIMQHLFYKGLTTSHRKGIIVRLGARFVEYYYIFLPRVTYIITRDKISLDQFSKIIGFKDSSSMQANYNAKKMKTFLSIYEGLKAHFTGQAA